MNKPTVRKRKIKTRSKNNDWKRSKLPKKGIFLESTFDSSDEDSSKSAVETPSKEGNLFFEEFKNILNLTPSKSETDIANISTNEEIDSENEISSLFEENYDLTENESSFTCGNMMDEFLCKGDNETHVVSITLQSKKPNEKKSKMVDEKTTPKEEDAIVAKSTVYCHYIPDGLIIVLEESQTIHFYGLCQLTVVHGKIEILGHVLDKTSPEIKAYSLRSSSLLYLKNITSLDPPLGKEILDLNVTNLNITKNCAIVLCKRLEDKAVSFIEKHASQQLLPKEDDPAFPRMVIQPKIGNFNYLKINQDWNRVIEKINTKTKLMVCGGKGVGKTTFLRYAINKLLSKYPVIRVIDLDPGQSEFVIPGCISIINVTEPMFGENFTHLQNAERSIVSNIDISYEPDRYIFGVQELVNVEMDEIPTLVNYMGYIHGMGIHLLSAAVTCIKPTDIVQISSRNYKKNFRFSITPSTIQENAEMFVDDPLEVKFNLEVIKTMCEENEVWTALPRQLREMSVLAYLSQMIEDNSVYRCSVPIYKISLGDINLSGLNGEKIPPAAVNASLVALCKVLNYKNLFQCLGWGIIRGIDLSSNELVLQTIEKLEILDKTTHLVLGGASLPPSIYMTPDAVAGPVPYVIEGQLLALGMITKRSRQSVKRQRGTFKN